MYVAWRACTTTLCISQLYPPSQGLWIGPQTWESSPLESAEYSPKKIEGKNTKVLLCFPLRCEASLCRSLSTLSLLVWGRFYRWAYDSPSYVPYLFSELLGFAGLSLGLDTEACLWMSYWVIDSPNCVAVKASILFELLGNVSLSLSLDTEDAYGWAIDSPSCVAVKASILFMSCWAMLAWASVWTVDTEARV